MVTEYAQIRRIQINELYSEHTHVITSQVKTSAPPEAPFMLPPSHLYFFFPKVTTIITFNTVISSAYFDICVNGIIWPAYLPCLLHIVFEKIKFVHEYSEISVKNLL